MDKDIKEREDWNKLRLLLKSSYDYNNSWEEAISLFNSRLERKFFDPVETIIKHQKLVGEGFAIVTVQCALIEALASFRTGEIYSFTSKGLPSYYYSQSKKMFVDFLHSEKIFENNFWSIGSNRKPEYDKPFNAPDFYTKVRCGLMHEARTKDEWNINATDKDVKKELIFLEQRGKTISILRTVLHHRLKHYVASYSEDLRAKGENDLRRYFARKLDHVYDKDPDPKNFDWWVDR